VYKFATKLLAEGQTLLSQEKIRSMTALAPLLKQISTAELGFDVFNTDNQTGYNTQFFSIKFIWKPKLGTELIYSE
jgi:hypothetical protein